MDYDCPNKILEKVFSMVSTSVSVIFGVGSQYSLAMARNGTNRCSYESFSFMIGISYLFLLLLRHWIFDSGGVTETYGKILILKLILYYGTLFNE